MSRNGVGSSAPFLKMRIVPPCSTTKRRAIVWARASPARARSRRCVTSVNSIDGGRRAARPSSSAHSGPAGDPPTMTPAVRRTAGGAGGVADDVARGPRRGGRARPCRRRRERLLGPREGTRVAQDRRDPDLVEVSVVGGELVPVSYFSAPSTRNGIVRRCGRRVVRVRDVAVRPVGLGLEDAVDEDPHPAVGAAALDGHVVPAHRRARCARRRSCGRPCRRR